MTLDETLRTRRGLMRMSHQQTRRMTLGQTYLSGQFDSTSNLKMTFTSNGQFHKSLTTYVTQYSKGQVFVMVVVLLDAYFWKIQQQT